ncbi:MAG: hypothetical protein GY913_10245 [Proteobacteria bacterium]|nr:hypothetical protein [Pseudomonadota bacterium]MCP4917292.1 hypothetical protein [Pseudomonadota bacterium]
MVPLLLLLACSDEEPTRERPDLTPVDDTPWTAEPPSPTWSAAQVEAVLQAAIDGGVPEPIAIRDAYLGLFDDHADGVCPSGTDYSLPGDYQACTTEDGAVFYGHAEYEPVDNTHERGFYLLGDCYIIDPDGDRFEGAGELQVTIFEEGDWTIVESMVMGTWGYPAAGGFLEQDNASAMFIIASTEASGSDLYLDGTMGNADAALSFELLVDTRPCDHQLTGTVSVREPSGYWHTITFVQDCDGCGDVVFADDQELGQICVDPTPLVEGPMAALVGEATQ